MVLKLSDSSLGAEAHPTNPPETSNKAKNKRTKSIKGVGKRKGGKAASNNDKNERLNPLA